MPSGCCTSPVIADGTLVLRRLVARRRRTANSRCRPSTTLLKDLDTEQRRRVSRERRPKKTFDGFFDSQDANKDGTVTPRRVGRHAQVHDRRQEHRLRPEARRHRRRDRPRTCSGSKTKGLPYIASAIVYRGQYVMVKDGGIVTAYDAKTGNGDLS